MRRFALTALVTLLAMTLVAPPAGAGKGWCRSDPIVIVDGVQLQFLVDIPDYRQSDVVGPVDVVLTVPQGVHHELVFSDAGFNGYGESFSDVASGDTVAADGSFTVTIDVRVPLVGNQVDQMMVQVISSNGNQVTVGGDTIGVRLQMALKGGIITTTSTTGASAIGASVTGGPGQSVTGQNAAGGSATGGTITTSRPSSSGSTPTPTAT